MNAPSRDFTTKIRIRNLCVRSSDADVLKDISVDVRAGHVTVIHGAADAGKTTLLRALNRLHAGARVEVSGRVELRGENVYAPDVQVSALRRRIGMVFTEPPLFPGSVASNVAYGLELAGVEDTNEIAIAVERALRAVGLWSDLRGDLERSPATLTRAHQQRLCVARALAIDPEVLLLDDPARLFDDAEQERFASLVRSLRARCTVVLATRSREQANRVGDDIVSIVDGRVVEATTIH